MFAYSALLPESIPRLLEALSERGVELADGDALLAYGDDYVEPVDMASKNDVSGFCHRVSEQRLKRVIAKLEGILDDVTSSLSMLFEFDSRVTVLSVPEDAIWAFENTPKEARIERLVAFVSLCKGVAEVAKPAFGYLGTESYLPEEIALERARELGLPRVDQAFFSGERVSEIFEWYLREYVDRWQTV